MLMVQPLRTMLMKRSLIGKCSYMFDIGKSLQRLTLRQALGQDGLHLCQSMDDLSSVVLRSDSSVFLLSVLADDNSLLGLHCYEYAVVDSTAEFLRILACAPYDVLLRQAKNERSHHAGWFAFGNYRIHYAVSNQVAECPIWRYLLRCLWSFHLFASCYGLAVQQSFTSLCQSDWYGISGGFRELRCIRGNIYLSFQGCVRYFPDSHLRH